MTYDELCDFIDHKMKMSHIYQPLLIRSLIDAGGKATIRQLAQFFLSQDESQLLYYENRIKQMPLKVLARHEIVERHGDLVHLLVGKLTLEQKAHLRAICEAKLQEYVKRKGFGIWDYRLLEDDPVPDSVRYQVLKEAKGRCALCGVTIKDRPIDVDHIIPRNRGGKNTISNLQALCSKCNRSKGDKDTADFRSGPAPERLSDCVFCHEDIYSRKIADNGTVFAIEDGYPVTPGHVLIIPYRHTPEYFAMSEIERKHADELLRVLKRKMLTDQPEVTGFNIGMNCGEVAGQTVQHAHIHLIPRRHGDVENPRGGVRHAVAGKGFY